MAAGLIDWGTIFQQAALEPPSWLDALQLLADATGSARAQLIGIGESQTIPFNWVTSFPSSALDDFIAMDGGSPQVNFRVAADLSRTPGQILDERDYDRVRPQLTSDVYLDYCSDIDIPFGCQTALITDDSSLIGLALLRGKADGRTTEIQRHEFARAADAARGAVKLQAAIEHRGAALLAGTFDALALECFLIDRYGCVAGMTAGATARIAEATVIRVIDQRLTSVVPAVTRAIERGLAWVFGGHSCATVRLTQELGPTLDLFRIEPQEWSLSFQPRVIGVIRDPAQRLNAMRASITQEFGLTTAETDIAILLAQGLPREEIAKRRGVTMLTLRTQIRSLYEKTECRREAELVGLVFRWVC